MDLWAQRLAAAALVISSIALLVGATTYAYKELSTLQTTSSVPKKK